jgi:hypothetical protein
MSLKKDIVENRCRGIVLLEVPLKMRLFKGSRHTPKKINLFVTSI